MAIVCTTEISGGYRHLIEVREHVLHADMLVAEGGQDSAPGAHDSFDVSQGPLSQEQRTRLCAAVGRCPVSKLMTTTEVIIETAPLDSAG